MTPDALITIGVLLLVVAGLASNRVSIDVVMIGGLTLLFAAGVIDVGQAASGCGSIRTSGSEHSRSQLP